MLVPRRSGRAVLLAGAAVFLLHAVDDLVVHRQPGVTAGRHGGHLALLAALVLTAAVAAPRVPAPARDVCVAAVALVLGAVSTTEGATHLAHAASAGFGGADGTGFAEVAAGLWLTGLSLALTARLVRVGRTRPRRWARGCAAIATLLATGLLVVLPMTGGTVQARMPRRPVAAAPGSGFLSVTLTTDDGLRLRGWYAAARNKAAVMILNSSRGDHVAARDHARFLSSQGYGVLVYDARGTGGSDGEPNGWGWGWTKDVDAGVDFLAARADVEAGRVALLGLSTGADVAIQAAAQDTRIRAVVADGATAAQFADRPAGMMSAVTTWPMFATAELLSGMRPGLPLATAISRVTGPVLLVASGSLPVEIPLNERYASRGGCNVTLWKLPEVQHVEAIHEVPDEYRRRLVDFLGSALRTGSSLRATSTAAPSCDD